MTPRVSLAELAAADIQLRPAEAVAIVTEMCRRCASGELPGMPTAGVIRVTRDGDVVVEGPMITDDDVYRAGDLLNDLLAGFDSTPEYRASGGLRLAVARALGTLDVPPYASLSEFCEALARFGSDDVRDVARALYHTYERGRASRELLRREQAALTISDIRRARRATGLTLEDVATVAEVPPAQLRELEWGYMRNWRADESGRAQVIRYARAAGLDEGVVLSIAWPMIQEDGSAYAPGANATQTALVPSGPQVIVLPHRGRAPVRRQRARYVRVAAAAVGVVLLLLATLFALNDVAPAAPATARADGVEVRDSRGTAPPVIIVPPPPERVKLTPASPVAPAARPAHRTQAPAAAPAKRRPPQQQKKPFLQREVIRFVFR
jgi:hypothetical protein